MTVAVQLEGEGVSERLLTFDDFVRMADDGYFGDSKHLELINGKIFDLAPISPGHSGAQTRTLVALVKALGAVAERLEADVRGPVTLHLDRFNAPEPDAAVVRRATDAFYRGGDALLVVEVAQTSQRRDLGPKMRLYAEAGVPEYWVVDAKARRLHVFKTPNDSRYVDGPTVLAEGDRIAPGFAPNAFVNISDLF